MKVFISGENYKTVYDKIRLASLELESKISESIAQKDFGKGVSFWGYISICCPPELYNGGFFKEIKKYNEKESEVELRLKVDYQQMLDADQRETIKILCESFLNGVNIAEKELNIHDFDFVAFKSVLIEIFQKEDRI